MPCRHCGAENDEASPQCAHCGGSASGPAKGELLASRWEVLDPLGQGGMGVVYKAHDRELDEIVALKVLRADLARSPEMAQRFRSEIKLARRVRHRHVCAIHEYGQDGPLRFIVMEFVEGVDLKRMLAQGSLPASEALEIAIQVAEALQAIHDMGIIHRDLKPANVMLDRRGLVRLMDFGIAKQFGADTSGLTAVGHIVGTPEYMSPEQARGAPLDARSDVYSLGVVLFETLAGVVPFRGDTPLAILFKHVHDPPPLDDPQAAGIPTALVPVLRRALAKSPQDRYRTASDLAAALAQSRFQGTRPETEHTLTLIQAALALQPDPAVAPTPRPAAVPTSVPSAVPTRAPAAVSVGGPAQAWSLGSLAPPRSIVARRPARKGLSPAGLALTAVGLAIVGGVGSWFAFPSVRESMASLTSGTLTTTQHVVPAAPSLAPPSARPPASGPERIEPQGTAADDRNRQSSPGPATTDERETPLGTSAPASKPAPAVPLPSSAAPPRPVATTPRSEPSAGLPSPMAPAAAQARLDRAEELFAQGRFASALAEAKAVLEREPDNRAARELVEDAEVELVVDKRLKEARQALAQGDLAAAREKVRLGLSAKPSDSRLTALWRELQD